MLLASGADPLAQNAFRLTPLDVATAADVRAALRRATARAAQAPLVRTPAQAAAAQQARAGARQALSVSLRTAAGRLTASLRQPPPASLADEAARVAELQAVKAAAVATNGLVRVALASPREGCACVGLYACEFPVQNRTSHCFYFVGLFAFC